MPNFIDLSLPFDGKVRFKIDFTKDRSSPCRPVAIIP